MLTFNPKTEDEIKLELLIEEGIYQFEVIQSESRTSKAGNPMIHLLLKVWDNSGKSALLHDYLLTSPSQMLFKLRHFCFAVGLGTEWESGSLTAENCMGKCGKAKVGIETDPSGKYGPKNRINDYVSKEVPVDGIPVVGDELNDDIPF